MHFVVRFCTGAILDLLYWCYIRLYLNKYLVPINRAGGLYGRILTEVASTDRTQLGLYQRPRSRFSHTDRPSSGNKMFIIWPNKKSKGQKQLFVPLRGLKHLAGLLLSLVSSPNLTKITAQSPASVCGNFVNEWRQNNRSFHTRSMKSFPKVYRILMPVRGSIAQRSALIQPCDLRLISAEKR